MQMVEKSDAVINNSKSSSKNKNFKENIQLLITALGGEDNIVSITHCMTRLRFKLADESLVDEEAIKQIADVKGVVLQQGQTQVIIGVEVEKWFNALSNTQQTDANPADELEKGKLFQGVMRIVAGIFGPVVPAIAGAGMLMGLLSGLIATNVISET
ncbi:PTS transporter subunit EIIB, partial [Vibrio splendidus]